ncbi:MAG: efflux RND transporter periplasmic adaptor subunit [Bacteroidetes bacterium]|nr:efflux RND transporter periplasmic adaptor subunit [Bacteroidota bacterium]
MNTIRNLLNLLLISVFIVGCGTQSEQNQEVPQETVELNDETLLLTREQFSHSGIVLANLQRESIYQTITTTGFLNVPQENRAVISSYMGGYISSTPLLPGDQVKKGQFLLSLTNPEIISLEQDYLIAKQSLAYLKTVFERQKLLFEEKISSQDMFLSAEKEYDNMLTSLNALRQRLLLNSINPDELTPENISPLIKLYSPIDGTLVRVDAVQGQLAQPGQELFEIVNTDHFHLEMKVFERDAATIVEGQKLTFVIPDAESVVYTGEVFLVGKAINKEDRTVDIHAHIDNPQKLPSLFGLFVEAAIVINERTGLCVPSDALVTAEGSNYLLVKMEENENHMLFERIPVSTGFVTGTCTEIMPAGLEKIGDRQFIVKGAYGLMPD